MGDIAKQQLRELYSRRGHLRLKLRHESIPTQRVRIIALLQAIENEINTSRLDGASNLVR